MKLPKELMQLIVEEVAKEQKKQYQNKNKEQKDWRLRNTRYLLENYRKLKSHCEEVVDDLKQYDDILERLSIDSVLTYKAKTAKMMQYVDLMLDSYKRFCDSQGGSVRRRYNVIYRLYVMPTDKSIRAVDVADSYGVDERTIRRDEKKAIEELSVYLFGIETLNDLIASHNT